MAVEEFAMERRKRAYRVSIEPPLESASGGLLLQRPRMGDDEGEPANKHVIPRPGAPGRRARFKREQGET
jgi:hypothetical protein